MLALAKSPLNQHYRETWEEACYYDGHGYIELTSYGQWLCGLTGPHLLAEMCPYVDAFALSDREVDRLLHFIAGVALPPPQQLSLL